MLQNQPFQCPCCDYYSLPQRYSFEVCPVCYWEDDGQDMDRLDEVSNPNHITLREARGNFRKFGACDQGSLALVATQENRAGLRREQRATFY